MSFQPTPKLRLFLAAICTLALSLQGCSARPVLDRYASQCNVFDEQRLQLTSAYSLYHYGSPGFKLTAPQMIVVHYTAIADLRDTLEFFRPALLDSRLRRDIAGGGAVNVSAHYVVDEKGKLFQLAAEDVVCRHTIGFNHTAIGIENVASDAAHLTDLQAQASAGLISRIVERHPTVRYLIGHHEYRDRTLPHYRLLVEHDASYRFTDKIDPGPEFMDKVRRILKETYGLTLSD